MTEINSIQDVFDGIDSFITNRTSEVTHTLPDHEVATCDAMAEGYAGLVDQMTADTFAMTAADKVRAGQVFDELQDCLDSSGGDLTTLMPQIMSILHEGETTVDEGCTADSTHCIDVPVNFWLFTANFCLTLPLCYWAYLHIDENGRMWIGKCVDAGGFGCLCGKTGLPAWLLLLIAALLGITIVGPAATGAAFQVLYNALKARAIAIGVIG